MVPARAVRARDLVAQPRDIVDRPRNLLLDEGLTDQGPAAEVEDLGYRAHLKSRSVGRLSAVTVKDLLDLMLARESVDVHADEHLTI